MKTVLYIHGKGGNASESTHYEKLFPDCKVIGLDYRVSRKTLSVFRDTRRSAFAERDFKGENFKKLKFFEVPCKTFSPWKTGKKIHEAVVEKQGASLTVMEGGEHWFNTEEEMKFLNEWIRSQK